MTKPSIVTAVMLTAALTASACGSSEPEEPAAQPTPTAASTTENEVATARPGEPTPMSPEARHVTEVLETDPVDRGWLLPAGTWVAPDFAEPLQFTTDRDLVIERAVEGAVWLRHPDDEVGRTWLIIADLGFVHGGASGAAEQPVPQTPEEITAEIERNPMSELFEQGTLGEGDTAIAWWDWTHVDPTGGTAAPCRDGMCISPGGTTSGETIPAVIGAPTRTYQVLDSTLTLGVWVTGAADGFEALVPAADAVAPSIRAVSTTPEAGTVSWWARTGRAVDLVPAGTYRSSVGSTLIDGELTAPLEGVAVDRSGTDILAFETGSGFFAFLEPRGLATPAVVDAMRDRVGLTDADLIDVDPSDADAVEAWLSALVDIETITETTVAGFDATTYDYSVRETAVVCGGLPCGPVIVLNSGFWIQLPRWTNQIITIPDANLLVHLEARPGRTIDELLAEMEPILDALTITPIG